MKTLHHFLFWRRKRKTTEAAFAELETLAGKSGKRGFKRPSFKRNCEGRDAFGLESRMGPEETREAFPEPPEE
jgi:hypothetical protein